MLYLIKITEWKKDSRYKNKIKHINKTRRIKPVKAERKKKTTALTENYKKNKYRKQKFQDTKRKGIILQIYK